jgi:hypothetical protein
MTSFASLLTPGMQVEHPNHREWGVGQVQSNINGRITVNFPEMGKVVIDATRIELVPVFHP